MAFLFWATVLPICLQALQRDHCRPPKWKSVLPLIIFHLVVPGNRQLHHHHHHHLSGWLTAALCLSYALSWRCLQGIWAVSLRPILLPSPYSSKEACWCLGLGHSIFSFHNEGNGWLHWMVVSGIWPGRWLYRWYQLLSLTPHHCFWAAAKDVQQCSFPSPQVGYGGYAGVSVGALLAIFTYVSHSSTTITGPEVESD